MSRKDFIHIASIIRDMPVDDKTRATVAYYFTDGLKQTNSQFKQELFFQAATGQVPLTARQAR